jgi:alpha,alpha-trehalose phosphorylase
VHVASTGGVWSALVSGFGGFRDHGGVFTLDPRLPESWDSLTYRLTLLGTRVKVAVHHDRVELSVEDGDQATLVVRGEQVTVRAGDPVTIALVGQGPRLEGQPEPVPGRRRSDGTIIAAIVPGT